MNRLIHRLTAFFKKETVLCIAALLAFASAFFVRPSLAYVSYIDFRVLALLFCLMLVVSGLQNIGVFQTLAASLLTGVKNTRQLVFLLTGLCFFSSMLITNDVSLITFVPFGIMVLDIAHLEKLYIPVIVLQTIAANLGSMFTPVGNPQNLYLYTAFSISMTDFLKVMFPLTSLSLLLMILAVILLPNQALTIEKTKKAAITSKSKCMIYFSLFLVCLLCVVHIISFQWMLVIAAAVVILTDRALFKNVDYSLLLTFVCFFIFIGNMEQIPAIADSLHRLIAGRELFLGILLSQCISNVPAAMLLSGFTTKAVPLLYGVNIGGLGTLIASLASLISYRYYANIENAKKGKYMQTFTLYNVVFLILLVIAGVMILYL
ncbi:MAG: citrate transporter [Clostridiales bacterium]|nr:citrate transporter [Clostridiales bacterium]MDY3745503.1 SLC13 family permease [Lachnospiraceae bacterium]